MLNNNNLLMTPNLDPYWQDPDPGILLNPSDLYRQGPHNYDWEVPYPEGPDDEEDPYPEDPGDEKDPYPDEWQDPDPFEIGGSPLIEDDGF